MMRIRFSEIAKNELNDACDWYERQQAGLGARFRRDVRESTLRIAVSPLLFLVELENVRRYVMNRFPFTLRYPFRLKPCWNHAPAQTHTPLDNAGY